MNNPNKTPPTVRPVAQKVAPAVRPVSAVAAPKVAPLGAKVQAPQPARVQPVASQVKPVGAVQPAKVQPVAAKVQPVAPKVQPAAAPKVQPVSSVSRPQPATVKSAGTTQQPKAVLAPAPAPRPASPVNARSPVAQARPTSPTPANQAPRSFAQRVAPNVQSSTQHKAATTSPTTIARPTSPFAQRTTPAPAPAPSSRTTAAQPAAGIGSPSRPRPTVPSTVSPVRAPVSVGSTARPAPVGSTARPAPVSPVRATLSPQPANNPSTATTSGYTTTQATRNANINPLNVTIERPLSPQQRKQKSQDSSHINHPRVSSPQPNGKQYSYYTGDPIDPKNFPKPSNFEGDFAKSENLFDLKPLDGGKNIDKLEGDLAEPDVLLLTYCFSIWFEGVISRTEICVLKLC